MQGEWSAQYRFDHQTVVDLATRAPPRPPRPLTCSRQTPVGRIRQADQVRMESTVDERGDSGKLGMGFGWAGWARMGSDGWFEVPGASDVHDVIDGFVRCWLGLWNQGFLSGSAREAGSKDEEKGAPTNSYLVFGFVSHWPPLVEPRSAPGIEQCSAHEMRSMLHGSMAVRLSEGLGRNKQFGETCEHVKPGTESLALVVIAPANSVLGDAALRQAGAKLRPIHHDPIPSTTNSPSCRMHHEQQEVH